jgi:ubiquinone/menaquinone biosynthesis C-methylase UbiE
MRSTATSIPWQGSRLYVGLLYKLWSQLYDETIALDPAYRGNARRLVDKTVRDGDEVLDVGIGTGLLAELGGARASRYVGVDYSGAMLAKAARKIADARLEPVTLQWGDARSLRFPEGSFDVVLSSFVLPHFERSERAGVVAEMVRVLRPGGRLGLFLALGEVAPLFPTRAELDELLPGAGLTEPSIEDRDDVYRIVIASKP